MGFFYFSTMLTVSDACSEGQRMWVLLHSVNIPNSCVNLIVQSFLCLSRVSHLKRRRIFQWAIDNGICQNIPFLFCDEVCSKLYEPVVRCALNWCAPHVKRLNILNCFVRLCIRRFQTMISQEVLTWCHPLSINLKLGGQNCTSFVLSQLHGHSFMSVMKLVTLQHSMI